MNQSTKSSEGVYCLSLELENVRCFAGKQKLDLSDGNGRPAQWTVILGDNGTGKTTLLEVLEYSTRLHFGGAVDGSPINGGFLGLLRNHCRTAKISYNYATDSTVQNKEGEFSTMPISVEIPESGNPKILEQPIFDGRKIKILAYKATRKLTQNETMSMSGELINAEEWLRETDYIANKPSDIQTVYEARFKTIKDVLINLLPDVKDIRITVPTEKSPNPRVEFQMPDGWLLLSQLSLGYQTMTAWIVDLAARLFNSYPNSPNPIAEPAVVLIDEIDLHLHPKWQRTIMSYLSERFVNTQFIVTAHSPLIVQAAENANIVVLKREGDGVVIHQEALDVRGWRIDQLLTSDLFDIPRRSPHYEKLLEQRRQILGKAHLSAEDQAQLKILEAQIDDLPTADTAEDIKAMDIIRRAARLLEKAQ